MSYKTLKVSLTSNADEKTSMHKALDEVYNTQTQLYDRKQGIIDTIIIPAIKPITEYIIARQAYLNDQIPHYGTHMNVGSADKPTEWRSPVSHEFTGSSLTTSLCHQAYFGDYETAVGSINSWQIERWTNFRQDTPGSTFTVVPCARYTGEVESYSDITQDKLDLLTGEPYSLEIVNRHSLSNLQHLISSFSAAMEWIWATNDPTDDGNISYNANYSPSSTNPYYGTYNTWGINENINHLNVAINALSADIGFREKIRDLNTQY